MCHKSTNLFHPVLPPYIILALVSVQKEHRSFPPRPSTSQYYWLRYVCEQCGAGPVACNYSDPAHHSPPRPSTIQNIGSGTCARGVPLLPTPPFHHAILLAPVRVREFWRWSCSMQIQRHSPSVSTPSFHHSQKYWFRYVCEKNTVLSHPALPPFTDSSDAIHLHKGIESSPQYLN